MNKKKHLVLATAVALLCFLVGCSGESPPQTETESPSKLRVVTTFTVIADMAKNVAGDAADVISVTKAGAEIHNYQPTPKDIARTVGADLILWNGMGLELWFEKFLQQLDGVQSSTVTDGIEPISIGKGPYSGKPNPHAWMSPTDALIYVDNIANALSDADPENHALYQKNAADYKNQISEIARPVRERLLEIPETERWLVTSEGAFSYLTRDYNLKELYLWPINADQQGVPSQVRDVIDTVKKHNIQAIFSESTISAKPAMQVARETGAHYAGVLYVDSLSTADGPVPTYLDLIRVTMNTIVEGLSADRTKQ